MPPKAVRTLRDLLFWQYAKIISESAGFGKSNYGFIMVLTIAFFFGLVALEFAHMLILGRWNDMVFNGIMLVVGTIVGAVWGRQNG